MKFLKSLFSPPREVHCEFGRPAPLSPLAAIGDIHGRADLLEQLLARLEPDLQVICVGDYVDRGTIRPTFCAFCMPTPTSSASRATTRKCYCTSSNSRKNMADAGSAMAGFRPWPVL